MQEYYAGNGNMNQGGELTPMTRERLVEYFEATEAQQRSAYAELEARLQKYEPKEPFTCKISKEREHPNAFAVMRMEVPDFPSTLPTLPNVARPLTAILAANDDGDAWGFVSLSIPEKVCIGDALENGAADWGVWYYCQLYDGHAVI